MIVSCKEVVPLFIKAKSLIMLNNYTTTEKEMLSIVATDEVFQFMLLSASIHVFTNHRQLIFDDLKTQMVLDREHSIVSGNKDNKEVFLAEFKFSTSPIKISIPYFSAVPICLCCICLILCKIS